MKLKLVIVGRDRSDPIVSAADEFVARIKRHLPIEVIQVKEEPLKSNAAIERVKQLEAERIEQRTKGDYVIALDQRGKALDSVAISKRLSEWMSSGPSAIAFAIGGPAGLDPEFTRRANERWSLSSLTLPHKIARLLLSEQLYRALTIIRGEPYHK